MSFTNSGRTFGLLCIRRMFRHHVVITGFAQNGHSLGAWQLQISRMNSSMTTVDTYTRAINDLCSDPENITRGCMLLDEAHGQGLKLQVFTYSLFVEQLVREMRIQEALDVVKDYRFKCGGVPTIFMCNSVIEGLCKLGRTDEALKLLRSMKHEFKCDPNVVTYNSVIASLKRFMRMDEVRALFVEMKQEDGCAPDACTYGIYIDGLCRQGKVDEGKLVFRDMIRSGCEPDPVTYNILIESHCREGKVVEAEKLFKQMVKSGVYPNRITYTALIDGHLRLCQLEEALVYFREMVTSGARADVACVSGVLDALTRINRLDEAVMLLDGIMDTSTMSFPSQSCCQFLLDKLVALHKLEEFLHVLCRMAQLPEFSYRLVELWKNTIIKSGSNRIEELVILASAKLKVINSTREPPSKIVVHFLYGVVLDCLEAEGKVDEVCGIFQDMIDHGYVPDAAAHGVVMRSLRKAGRMLEAQQLIEDMNYFGFVLD